MIRAVNDTNVLVSASTAEDYSAKIIGHLLIDKSLFFSVILLKSYKSTRSCYYQRIQKKYPLYFFAMQSYIKKIEKAGKLHFPKFNFTVITRDVSDNIFPDAAFAAEGHYIITGNHNDFTISTFENTKIISPKLFWELYEKGQL